MYGEVNYPYAVDVASCAVKKSDLCDETHPSDGQPPVRPAQDQKGSSGRQDTGHGRRSIGNDERDGRGHAGHRDRSQRPIEEQ